MTSDQPEPNRYSPLWFDFFHVGIDEARTNREVEFVCACAPSPEFQTILDVCCGMGRHARALSARGYSITGIDRDDRAITAARALNDGPNYIQGDIRDYPLNPNKFDAVIIMGQSFGHFDEATNRAILSRFATSVRPGGRLILDVWNPEFFAAQQGERELKTAQGNVREMKRVEGDRLFVELDYPDGTRENFEWQLFNAQQMKRLGKLAGLQLLTACGGFELKKPPSRCDPRVEFLLQRSEKSLNH